MTSAALIRRLTTEGAVKLVPPPKVGFAAPKPPSK